MDNKKLINGVAVAIKTVGGIIGDCISVPGIGTLIDTGTEKIVNIIHEEYSKNINLETIFTKEVSDKLKIGNYELSLELAKDALQKVQMEDLSEISLKHKLLAKCNYNVQLLAENIITTEYLKEDEYHDAYKAVAYTISVVLLNIVKKDQFLFEVLQKLSVTERRITNIELELKKSIALSLVPDMIGLETWSEMLQKYQEEERNFKLLFRNKVLDSSLLPDILIGDERYSLIDYILSKREKNENVRLYATGVGGSGKTFSLINVWKELLEKNISCIYVPLSKIDTKAYGTKALEEWLKSRIFIYDNVPSVSIDEKYKNFLADVANASEGAFVLLMDGVNEMKDSNILRILEQWQSYKSVSVITTSRSKDFLQLGNSEEYANSEFVPLSEEVVLDYLGRNGIDIANEVFLTKELLKMPQMLTLYVGTSAVRNRYEKAIGLDWRENVYSSDIIHNYLECQIAEIAYEKSINTSFAAVLLVRYILPGIAWEMYQNSISFISRKEIKKLIQKIIIRIYDDTQELPVLLEQVFNPETEIKVRDIVFLMLNQLSLFEEYENDHYYFVHQNFYDYLISTYWINLIRDSISGVDSMTNC